MSDITLMDVLYTGGMLVLAFYGAIFITKLISKFMGPMANEKEVDEKEGK